MYVVVKCMLSFFLSTFAFFLRESDYEGKGWCRNPKNPGDRCHVFWFIESNTVEASNKTLPSLD